MILRGTREFFSLATIYFRPGLTRRRAEKIESQFGLKYPLAQSLRRINATPNPVERFKALMGERVTYRREIMKLQDELTNDIS